jgi:AraC-like DNA-binding protein
MGIMGFIGSGQPLLRHLNFLSWFAKDKEGRFLAANPAFLEMAELKSESQLIGKTDFDLWPRFLAEHYVKDDQRVMETSSPMVNKIELVLRRNRAADWFSTTKAPLLGPDGKVAGVEGVCRYLKKAKAHLEPTDKLTLAIDYIMDHYAEKIDIPSLAALAGLSVKQFERRFKKEYGAVPTQYIQRIRLDAARQLLAGTRLSIAQISRETGFYDSSHFSHQFHRYTGFTPKAFRQEHRPGS